MFGSTRYMASYCPVCNHTLIAKIPLFPIFSLKKMFYCEMCGWKMSIAEVRENGGLGSIKKGMMNQAGKKTSIGSIDNNGYERGIVKHSNLVHRQIAYKEIYLKHRDDYPLPFSQYVIHHIDGNKQNNDPSNLKILTKEEHEAHHRNNKY